MKKNILYLLGFITLPFLFGACEDLNRDIITTLEERKVLESFDFTRNRLSAIYSDLPSGFASVDGAMMASASDDALHNRQISDVYKFNTGSWNALDNPDDVWNHYYRGIRKANQFLQTADSVNHDIYALDPDPTQQQVYQNRLATIERWKHEARFLRAYFYFELVKRYGGVPLITEVYSLGDDYEDIQRNTFEETINFIVDECDAAAQVLSPSYSGDDLGRATSIAALALKSRVLLYAASDLFNDPATAGGTGIAELVTMPQGDRNARWKAAADAAKDVIDRSGGFLNNDYRSLFRSYNSGEIIFARRAGASNSFETANYPAGFDLVEGGTGPSQNLVDAYEMRDGSPFDWNNPEHSADPYANRDPRLGMSIITNNSVFKGRNIEIWPGGRDGPGLPRATRTGYYLKKYVDENLNLLENTTSIHTWILIRQAEMYLIYAEALNEYAPGDPDIKLHVDLVRERNGVDMPALPDGLSQAEMRKRIRNERRVELAFEGHRIWDLRRWREATNKLDAPLRGVSVRQNDTSFEYTPIDVQERSFDHRMNLYPIPQVELNKSPGLVQNPGW